jgi:hypothetical protein
VNQFWWSCTRVFVRFNFPANTGLLRTGGTVSLSNLVFVFFNANGDVGFTSGPTSQVFSSTESEPGIGNSGWLFGLDATQQAAAQAAINAGFDLFGLSATVTDSTGGPETFYLMNKSTVSATEPPTLWLLGAGLLLVGAFRRRLFTL